MIIDRREVKLRMSKRYSESTRREGIWWGLGPSAWRTTVRDLETGEQGDGYDWDSPRESRERAWKDLREKQGK